METNTLEQTEKTITLYKDEENHLMKSNEIEAQRKAWQAFVDAWKDLELGELDGQQLMNVYAATEVVAYELWKQKVDVPPGFEAESYYGLLKKPDFTSILKARQKLNQLHPELFFVEHWTVKVNENAADQLKALKDIVLVKNSKEHKAFKKLHDLRNLLQEFRLLRRNQVDNSIAPINLNQTGLNYNPWASQGSEGEFEFNPQRLKQFLATL